MNDARTRLERIAAVLQRHGVEYIVVGGIAANLYGSKRQTEDVDLAYRREKENLERLAAALREITVSLRGAPPDLPFTIDARALALGANFTFSTPLGDLDLLGWLEPIGDFEAVAKNAQTIEADGERIHVISLDDLIRIKQHLGRPKDLATLAELLAIREEQERIRREERKSGSAQTTAPSPPPSPSPSPPGSSPPSPPPRSS